VFEAEVMRVEPFGIFVRVNCDNEGKVLNLEGLVHISEVSWEKVSELSTMFKVKDKLKIKLINKDDGRLQFSIKRLTNDPWDKIEDKYPKDKETEGEVVRIANFGALVKLETGVEGLIHVSKLTGGTNLKEGDKVQIYIESIDVQKRKISLGIVETSKKNVIYK
jgi:small subunit ribosomal protein S1